MSQAVAPKPGEIVLLSGHDLRGLLKAEVVIEALREAYAALAGNPGDQGRSVGFMIEGGSIHVKSGLLPGSHLAFASKVNVNLPDNWKLRQLPTIQGVVVVSDAKDGRPLAIMDSITLTGIRTAATAAPAAVYGARKDSKRAAIIGCGPQAKYQLSTQILEDAGPAGRSPRDAILAKIRKSALSACLNTVAAWIVRSGQRRALRELAEDGRLLSDVSLTREQALGEAGTPFWRR
jgi:ornithine cyclodeaminase/alanine dehydrogenase-like protein (mu-crystallin family)